MTATVSRETSTLAVSEVFGPTLAGEGPSLGRLATFIRLGACNLHCTWCDTPYTWDASRFDMREQISRRVVGELLAEVIRQETGLTVITGGEPLLQQNQRGWAALLQGLPGQVEVETNGTLAPQWLTRVRVNRFNVSPKLAHAGDPVLDRIRVDALKELAGTGKAVFKFVARTPDDLVEVEQIRAAAGIPPGLVWVMAEGTDPAVVLERTGQLAAEVIGRGWNLTTRLHILLWGDERGR